MAHRRRGPLAGLLVASLASSLLWLQGCGGSGAPAPSPAPPPAPSSLEGTAFVVESIPLDTTLELTEGARHTWEVLVTYINEAKQNIDFTAMYWKLVDVNQTEKNASWGKERGEQVYDALRNAAKRGVQLRAICGVGISGTDELEAIQKDFPQQVTFQLYNASLWYGGGIMHMKAWVFDETRALVTSSNTDWRSLTQVKEMGIAVEGSQAFEIVRDLQQYFDRWWKFTSPSTYENLTHHHRSMFDPYLQQPRRVPCFSLGGTQIPGSDGPTCSNPMASFANTSYNLASQMQLVLNGSEGGTFLSCSPPEVCDTPRDAYSQFSSALSGRTWDGDAVVQTILLARTHVNLTVMDFLPSAMYDNCAGAWWPALNDALLAKVAQGVEVRLLISKWLHTLDQMEDYLHALRQSAEAVVSGVKNASDIDPSRKGGFFEIRLFELPGWQDATGEKGASYPDHSRVNHAKYIVTDRRFNVGTSNMEWSYYHNTAGTSFNSDHPLLRAQLSKAFQRDWDSEYAHHLGPEASAQAAALAAKEGAHESVM